MDLDCLPGRSLADLLAAARTAGFAGVNVTFPCKEAVLPLLDEVSRGGARDRRGQHRHHRSRAGRTVGHNTDRTGFRRSVEETIGRDARRRRQAVLVGAGGAGRAWPSRSSISGCSACW